jgi:hypothetical protein
VKVRRGMATLEGFIQKAVAQTLAGAESLVGAVRKATGKVTGPGAVAPAGLLTRQPTKRPKGTVAFGTDLRFAVEQYLDGSVVLVSSVRKAGAVRFEGEVGLSGDRSNLAAVTAAGVLTLVRRLTRSTSKRRAGSVALEGGVRKAAARTVVSEVTLTGVADHVGGAVRLIAGAVTLASSMIRSMTNRTRGTVTAAGRVVKQVSRPAGGAVTPAGGLRRSVSKVTAGAAALAGAVTREAGKVVGGAATLLGSVRRAAAKVLGGSVTPEGEVNKSRDLPLFLSGAVALAGAVGRSMGKAVGGAVTLTGSVGRTVGQFLRGVVTLVSTIVHRADGPSFEPSDGGPSYRTAELRVLSQGVWTILQVYRTAQKIIWKVLKLITWAKPESMVYRTAAPRVWRSDMATPESGVDTRYMTVAEVKTFGFDFQDEGIVRQGAVLSNPEAFVGQYGANTSQMPTLSNPSLITNEKGFLDSDGKRIPTGKGTKCRVTPAQPGKFRIAMRVTATLGTDVDILEANGILEVSATI